MDSTVEEQISQQGSPAPSVNGAQAPALKPNEAAVALARKHFQLGWSIAELRARLSLPSEDNRTENASAADKLGAQLWRGSQWRIAFDRVSSLHDELQIDGPAKDGRYDPGEQRPPYAYARDADRNGRDIADKGIIPAADLHDDTNQKDFTLREAARRTINCLDLLYLDPDVMVNNDELRKDQAFLIDTVERPSAAEPTPASTPPAEGTDEARLLKAKRTPKVRVRHDALVLLDLWSGYLREQLAQKATDRDTTTLLVAFQCGQSMSSMSWNVTARALETEPGEHSLEGDNKPGVAAAVDPDRSAFEQAFDDRAVSYLQHQLAILAGSFDDENAKVLKMIEGSLKMWQRAVDWLAALADSNDARLGGAAFDRDLRIALVQQTSIWQGLILGQETLDAFVASGIASVLRVKAALLLAAAITPRQIVELERTVITDAQAALQPLETQVIATIRSIGTNITTPLVDLNGDLWRKSRPFLLGIGAVLALLIVLSIVVVAFGGNALEAALNGLGAVVVAVLGGLHLTSINEQRDEQKNAVTREVNDKVNEVRAQVDSAVKAAGDAVGKRITEAQQSLAAAAQSAQSAVQKTAEEAADVVHKAIQEAEAGGQRAMKELDDDLHDLESILAITYPLIEYVSSRMHGDTAQGASPQGLAATFLTTVLWSEQDTQREVLRVAYAGFGITGMAAVSKALERQEAASTARGGTRAALEAGRNAAEVELLAPRLQREEPLSDEAAAPA